MTSTRTIANALRASVVAGLVGAATLGVCGTAAAQPGTFAPAPSVYASLHTGHVVGDLDDDGGSDGGGYDAGGYDGGSDGGGYDAGYDGGGEVADEQPAEPAEEPAVEPSAPQEEESPAAEPQDDAPQEAPAEEQPAAEQPDMAEPAEEPAEAPAEAPAEEPAESPAPEQAPEPAAPDAPAPEAPAPDTAPADAPAPDSAPSASPQDVDTAQRATPVDVTPAPASAATVDQLRTEITSAMTSTATVTSTTWNHEVTQWNSSWVSYDAFYRPVLLNPYRSALQLVYTYDNATRIITVDPLSSVVVNVPTVGVYGFTALTRSATGALTNVTVGSFTGGGYVPAKGQQRPTKPQSPPAKDNVLVRIAYANGISRPFRVKHLADLGDDAAVHARRVLIDGTTSAWGRWTTAAGGEKEFDITMTLQLPGLAGPKQAPLPGYGAVQLATAPRRAR